MSEKNYHPRNCLRRVVTGTFFLLLLGSFSSRAAVNEFLRGQISSPRFAPGYRQIVAFERQVRDVQQLFIYNWQTDRVEQVTNGEQATAKTDASVQNFEFAEPVQFSRFDGQLDWRPVLDFRGRQWFAFISSGDDKDYDIYLGYVDEEGHPGKDYIQLKQEGVQQYPRWSPDGDHLAFVAKGKGESDIYVAVKIGDIIRGKNTNTYKPVLMTNNPGQDIFPCWSPNGRYLAYQAMQNDKGVQNYGINLIDFGKFMESKRMPQAIRLSPELRLYHEYKPSWSPDGKYIAYYVSQGEMGTNSANRNQDIGILSVVSDPAGNIVEGRIKSGSSTRLESNVLSNRDTGPVWLNSAGTGSQDLFYVFIDDQVNPIKTVDLNCWLSNKFNCKREVSQNFGTQLHRDVAVIPLPDATVALAFVSQQGTSNLLNIRTIPFPSPIQRGTTPQDIIVYQEKSSNKALLRSLAFPGLGQRYKGQSLKSNVLAGSEVAALLGWLLFSSQYTSQMKDYDAARLKYMASANKAAAQQTFSEWQSSYDGVTATVSKTRIAAGIAVAIWAYNLWDVHTGFPLRLPKSIQISQRAVQIAPPQIQVQVHNGQPSYGVGLALQF